MVLQGHEISIALALYARSIQAIYSQHEIEPWQLNRDSMRL